MPFGSSLFGNKQPKKAKIQLEKLSSTTAYQKALAATGFSKEQLLEAQRKQRELAKKSIVFKKVLPKKQEEKPRLLTEIHMQKMLEDFCKEEDLKLKTKLTQDITKIPDEVLDLNISIEPFTRPVLIKACSHWGDRPGLEKWVNAHHSCPECRAKIDKKDLLSCVDLQKQIDGFLEYREKMINRLNRNIAFEEMKKWEEDYHAKLTEIKNTKNKYVLDNKRNHVLQIMQATPPIVLYKDPCVTECGHSVDFSDAKQCSVCHSQLKENQFFKDSHLKQQASTFKLEYDRLDKEAKQEKMPEDLLRRALNFQKNLKQMDSKKGEFINRNIESFNRLFIEQRIDALKLDITNKQHLAYWHNKTNHCWHGYGGDVVNLKTEVFRIPARVHQMMLAAAKPHDDAKEFMRAIDNARITPLSYFHQLFSCVMKHSEETKLVCESDVLDHLTLR